MTINSIRTSQTIVSLYTAAEASEILRVRKSWLERQAAARRIPFSMLGGSYRFTEAHLTEIIRIFEVNPAWTVSHESTPAQISAIRPKARRDIPQTATPLRPRPRVHTSDRQQRAA